MNIFWRRNIFNCFHSANIFRVSYLFSHSLPYDYLSPALLKCADGADNL